MKYTDHVEDFFSTILHEYADFDIDDDVLLGYIASLDPDDRHGLYFGFKQLAEMDTETMNMLLKKINCAWEFEDQNGVFTLLSELVNDVNIVLS